MSPEQLRGKTVDHRSDIFSVGAIVYEMLAGRRAFRGETEVDTITAVLRETPPSVNLEQSKVPVSFQHIIQHCLEKEPENRFQSARDLRFALETLAAASPGRGARFGSPRLRTKLLPWAVAGVLLVAALFLLARQGTRKISSPSYQRVTFDQGTVYSARFGPDFRSIVYGAAWDGRLLQLFSTVGDSLLAQPLNISDANLLAVSRTGELALVLHGAKLAHLATQGGMLARAPLAGGSPREILQDVGSADWDANGELAVVHHADGRDRIEYPIGHSIYQSDGGWISHLRISPQGDKIAFINHPAPWDDRGSVYFIDLGGRATVLTAEFASADGLSWSPDGKEVWFTGAQKGNNRNLFAASLSGTVRQILDLPEGMTLQDVAPDGRVLVSLDNERLAMATTARDGKPEDISWHDWSVAKDISRDGRLVLFEDSSEVAGASYSVAIRNIDGTPPIQLGKGSAGGLSPDGKWAISILAGAPGQVTLLPVGAGQSRPIAIPGLERIHNGAAYFLADAKHITINASEHGRGVRCYLADLDGGKPVPITPEGVTGGLVSSDGRYILGNNGTSAAVYTVAEGAPYPIPDLEPGFIPVQWSQDNSSIYGYRKGEFPTRVYKVNMVTGKTTSIQELQPETSTGVVSVAPVVLTRDASRFAYSYYQVFSVLYVISGVK
jgi:hypothetical protein